MIVYQANHKERPAFYIGKTVKTLHKRRLQHMADVRTKRTNSCFHKALRKHGEDAFEWKVLEECNTKEELSVAEIKWIKLVKDCGHKVYNLTDGGDGGDVGGSKYWKENGRREETKMKISNSLKEYYKANPGAGKGKKKGVPMSESAKQKARETRRMNPLSDEAKHKISLRSRGALNPSAKKIICTTTGEVFAYATLAAQKYNIDLSSIIKCCKGKAKSCNKMKFEYCPQD